MNIIQKALSYFGRQYIEFIFHDKKRMTCHAYIIGDRVYAHPYLPNTRTLLLPKGRLDGECYLTSWLPITRKTHWLYNKKTYAEAVAEDDKLEMSGLDREKAND